MAATNDGNAEMKVYSGRRAPKWATEKWSLPRATKAGHPEMRSEARDPWTWPPRAARNIHDRSEPDDVSGRWLPNHPVISGL